MRHKIRVFPNADYIFVSYKTDNRNFCATLHTHGATRRALFNEKGRTMSNSKVFFDITANDEPMGRIVM
ncbi:hypothetical protein QN382_22840, partial [Pseudomonas sp. 10B1]|uniref:hypothetical protein n=1 Tax=Pseudomonas sp. 10B1 TaxID=3048573 RepID=UPI002B23D786